MAPWKKQKQETTTVLHDKTSVHPTSIDLKLHATQLKHKHTLHIILMHISIYPDS